MVTLTKGFFATGVDPSLNTNPPKNLRRKSAPGCYPSPLGKGWIGPTSLLKSGTETQRTPTNTLDAHFHLRMRFVLWLSCKVEHFQGSKNSRRKARCLSLRDRIPNFISSSMQLICSQLTAKCEFATGAWEARSLDSDKRPWSRYFILSFQVHLSQSRALSGIPLLFSTTCHNVELILQAEVPHVHSAFKMSGFAPAQVSLSRSPLSATVVAFSLRPTIVWLFSWGLLLCRVVFPFPSLRQCSVVINTIWWSANQSYKFSGKLRVSRPPATALSRQVRRLKLAQPTL